MKWNLNSKLKPRKSGDYIVAHNGVVDMYYFDESAKRWLNPRGHEVVITHWTKLPEHPKEVA